MTMRPRRRAAGRRGRPPWAGPGRPAPRKPRKHSRWDAGLVEVAPAEAARSATARTRKPGRASWSTSARSSRSRVRERNHRPPRSTDAQRDHRLRGALDAQAAPRRSSRVPRDSRARARRAARRPSPLRVLPGVPGPPLGPVHHGPIGGVRESPPSVAGTRAAPRRHDAALSGVEPPPPSCPSCPSETTAERSPLGEGPGLVEAEHVDPAEGLDRGRVAHQGVAGRQPPGGGELRERGDERESLGHGGDRQAHRGCDGASIIDLPRSRSAASRTKPEPIATGGTRRLSSRSRSWTPEAGGRSPASLAVLAASVASPAATTTASPLPAATVVPS